MTEKIKFAATRHGNHIITGQSHAECLRIAKDAGFSKVDNKFGQGFLTTKLRFVLRREALEIAKREKQITKKHPPLDELMSEDLDFAE